MDAQTIQDAVVLTGMAVVRIGLPLLLLVGLSSLGGARQRITLNKARRRSAHGVTTPVAGLPKV